MKRRILALLLAVLTLTALTAAAFAADDTTAMGAYNIKSLVKGYQLAAVDAGDGDGGFYANAKKFSLTCEALTGDYSLVLLLNQDGTEYPTKTNLYYIDQKTIEAGKATFSIIPKAMTDGATYNVYVSTNGTDGALAKVASFQYGTKPPYTLGDVDNDGKINSSDALLVLQHSVEILTLKDNALLAADVDKDGRILSSDALLILQHSVGIKEIS